ncbi:hypothetical protein [Novispirillum itersonii]|uniref:ABM domain-containing protein n=1 Tax=Novispirillum itersonii TaxID=189 RepID=A0A7W9ZGZ9_NOVIT|nr:hypothetical protein [Novispirillum itersonii]MBB6211311.1 hypothetical protein [Novispirillum itersonii]
MDPVAHAVELSTFRARAGVSPAEIETAYTRIRQEYMPRQPGVIRHDWFCRADGVWVDLLVADSLAAAHQACAGWFDHPATQALMALMEPGSPQMGFWVPGPMPEFLTGG